MKLALLACTVAIKLLAQDESGPKQPIAFNHKLHVSDLKQPCKMCHANPDPGEMAGMPGIAKCLECHSAIAAKTQAERKLLAFGKQNREVDWVRVYQIPTFVRFDHRQHAEGGVKCETCHGPIAQRTALYQERDVSMGTCVSCHRETRASLDCGSCHEPR